MKKFFKKLITVVAITCCMLFSFLFSACTGNEDGSDDQETNTITINYHFAELSLFDTFQLKIEENEVIEWSSENNAIASVDENGLVTAVGKSIIRMLPPLIVTEAECDKAFDILKESVETLLK